MQAPTNITTTKADINGSAVLIGWTDPNTTTTSVKIYTVDGSGNPTSTEVNNLSSVAGKWALLLAGTYALALKDSGGNLSPKVVFTTATATVPVPPTPQQMIQTALGVTLNAGDLVQVYPPTPTTSKTVQADGSIT
jgi:hypothetical protein